MQPIKGSFALNVGLALFAVLVPAPTAYAQTPLSPPGPVIVQLSAGLYHTCALLRYGSVQCWGGNAYGQANNQVGPFIQISAGNLYTCGLKSDGSVQCWGFNLDGQTDPQAGPFTQIDGGNQNACGVRTNGNLHCWGLSPSPITGDSNQDYPPPPAGPFTQVSVSGSHACALTPVSMGNLSRPPGVRCWPKDSFSGDDGTDFLGRSFVQITVGDSFNCALSDDGYALCWGANIYGQSSPPSDLFLQLSAGYLFTCGIRADNSVACWGYNFYGQVSHAPPTTSKFTQVAAGNGHACATDGYTVTCWGRNDHGQATPPSCLGICAGAGGGGLPPLTFSFQGFDPPLAAGQADPPTLNVAESGSAVPLKFSLGGDMGLNVIAAGYPASQPLNCDQFDPYGALEAVHSAGNHGLSYDPQDKTYTYVWKTDRAWAGTCRVLSLKLTDGTVHLAAFRFQ